MNAKAFLDRDLMLVLDNEGDIFNFVPDYRKIADIPEGMGMLISGKAALYCEAEIFIKDFQ